jgi:hypothetical protein
MSGCAGCPLVPAAEQAEAATAAGDAEGGPRQLRHRAGSRVRPPSNSNVEQTVLTMVADNLRVVFVSPAAALPTPRAYQSAEPPTDIRTGSRLQSALRTRVDCVERCRAADVKPISLLTAEAQVGDSFRYVDLAEQIAAWSVAAHAGLVRIGCSSSSHRRMMRLLGISLNST